MTCAHRVRSCGRRGRLRTALLATPTLLVIASGAPVAGAPAQAADRALPTVPTLQIGHSFDAVAVTPDGRQIISASTDRTVKVWDVRSGHLIRTFDGHQREVYAVAAMADGRRVVSAGWDMRIAVWELETGRLLAALRNDAPISELAVTADDRLIVTVDFTGKVKLWDVAGAREIRTLKGATGPIAFTPDGRQLVTGTAERRLARWDVTSGGLLARFGHSAEPAAPMAVTPDGRAVIVGDVDQLKVWGLRSGRLVGRHGGHGAAVKAIAVTPDGARILSVDGDGVLIVRDRADGRIVGTFREHKPPLRVTRDGQRSISRRGEGELLVRNLADGRVALAIGDRLGGPAGLTVLPDGRHGATADGRLWDLGTGRPVRPVPERSGGLRLLVTPDGERWVAPVIAADGREGLRVWDVRTGELLHGAGGEPMAVASASFAAGGERMATLGGDGVRVWDVRSGHLLRRIDAGSAHPRSVDRIAITADGRRVVTAGRDWNLRQRDNLRVWDADTGEPAGTLEGHRNEVTDLVASRDGRQLVSCARGEAVKLWELPAGRHMRSFQGPGHGCLAVAVSPDGRRVIAGGEDKAIRVWDAGTGAQLSLLAGHTSDVVAVAVSEDGTRIVSQDAEGATKIWRLDAGALLATIGVSPANEWLALTPAGFFAASGRASDMLAVVRGLEVTALPQVHQSLFNPDLVRLALAGDPDGEVARAAEVISLDKVLDSGPAPEVAILAPGPDARSAQDVVDVEARITDNGKGIGRIEWRVNGVTAAVATGSAGAAADLTLSRRLALDPGRNVIEVVAYNAGNLLASLPARTTVELTAAADRSRPRLHILAIGINKYADRPSWHRGRPVRPWKPLAAAVNDARAFAAAMTAAAGTLYENDVRIRLVLDEEATRERLDGIVESMAEDIHPRDTFILFAAAHGYTIGGRFYLIPQDFQGGTNPEAVAAHAIGQDRLQDWLANRIKARKAIVLLDTCESGAVIAGHLRSRAEEAAAEAGIGRLHEATGRPILTAAATGQFAYERQGEAQSAFTRAVLEALREGDSDRSGTIELSELVTYVQAAVPRIAASYGGAGRAETIRQTARFGSRGEDYAVASRLP